MAWKYQCVLFITLVSAQSFETFSTSSQLRSERSGNQKTNGSYKIINRYGKPFVNKRVPEGSVVFPGLTSRSGDAMALQIPEECQRLGICEQAPNYKDDLVASIIEDFKRKNKTFNSDVLETPQIAERIGPDEDNVELCTSTERLYIPKLAQDADKEWHRIINNEGSSMQKFRVEICSVQSDAPCSPVANFQTGYQARCVQKYALRHMVAINNKDEVIEKPFRVPSCCSCVAKVV